MLLITQLTFKCQKNIGAKHTAQNQFNTNTRRTYIIIEKNSNKKKNK